MEEQRVVLVLLVDKQPLLTEYVEMLTLIVFFLLIPLTVLTFSVQLETLPLPHSPQREVLLHGRVLELVEEPMRLVPRVVRW